MFSARALVHAPAREARGDDDLRKMRHGKPGWLALLRRVRSRDVAGGKSERPDSIPRAKQRRRRQRASRAFGNHLAISAIGGPAGAVTAANFVAPGYSRKEGACGARN